MREDLLAQVLGLPAPEVAVLAQRGMPTYCWTAARAWCLLHGYLPAGDSIPCHDTPSRPTTQPHPPATAADTRS